jgi:hypothetical protein
VCLGAPPENDPDQQRANGFSNYTDAELLAELGRLSNELGIKTILTLEPSDEERDFLRDTPMPARS